VGDSGHPRKLDEMSLDGDTEDLRCRAPAQVELLTKVRCVDAFRLV
jgi:hypothetical protein